MKFQKFIGAARLGQDPELRHTDGGTAICKMRLVFNRRVKRGDMWEDSPVWIDADIFGKRGEAAAKHFGKGDQIFVEAELDYQEWEAKDGGGKRSKLSLFVRDWDFVGSRQGDGGSVW